MVIHIRITRKVEVIEQIRRKVWEKVVSKNEENKGNSQVFLFWIGMFSLKLFTKKRNTAGETRVEQKKNLVSDMLGLRCQGNIQEKYFY